jgi:DNA-binding CsgD family transcriptional regulator
MQPDIQKLHTVWHDHQMAKQKTILPRVSFDEVVSSILSVGPSYFYVIDFFDMRLSHVSASIKEIHDLDPENVTFNDILNLIHPDDMEHVSQSEAQVLYVLYKIIKPDKITKYKMNYSFRFKTLGDIYKLFLHQAITLTVDENGGIAKSLNIHTDISHITKINNYEVSLIGLFGEPSYMNLKNAASLKENPVAVKYTKREVEIIKLMSEGASSLSIAKNLSISLDTVKNHRKNMLHKSNCKNMVELVKLCIINGII